MKLPIPCRTAIPLLLAAATLAGCETYDALRRDIGLAPPPVSSPAPAPTQSPRPAPTVIATATAMPVVAPEPAGPGQGSTGQAGGIGAQSSWAAQRAMTEGLTHQGNTTPVDYKEPPPPVSAPAVAVARPTAVASVAVPAMAATPAAVPMPSAMPAPAATIPGLPAGYRPSPSAIDQPAMAQQQQALAAAAGAQPTPPDSAAAPAMTASMAAPAGLPSGAWKAHLASHRSEAAAINEWQELLRTNAALYGQFDPQVEWADTPRGSFARLLLVGFAERKDADGACARLRSATRYCASVKD